MMLVQITTRGREVEDDLGHLIGFDGIEVFYRLVAHEDDLDQWTDGEQYASVKVLTEDIEHTDVLGLCEQSVDMQHSASMGC